MDNIRKLRKLSNLNQRMLAKDLGVTQAAISLWEKGEKTPSIDTAIQIAKYFGVSVGCVVGTEPIPEGYPDLTYFPVSHEQVIKDQQQAAAEGRIMNPEFQPEYAIGKEQPEPGKATKKKPPFTREQEEYLEEMEDRIAEKVATALREDSSLLRGTGTTEE